MPSRSLAVRLASEPAFVYSFNKRQNHWRSDFGVGRFQIEITLYDRNQYKLANRRRSVRRWTWGLAIWTKRGSLMNSTLHFSVQGEAASMPKGKAEAEALLMDRVKKLFPNIPLDL